MSNQIVERYNKLAQAECCLSCGGAVNYAKPQQGQICVDLGCGKGNDVIKLAKKVGETGFIYGIDISDKMIEKAQINVDAANILNVKFITCELENIDLADETADIIISNCVINHSSNKQLVWNNIYRILKNKGRFFISDIYSIEPIPEIYRNDPDAVAECWAGAIIRSQYLEILQNAGFHEIEILEESIPSTKGKVEVASFTISGQKMPQN